MNSKTKQKKQITSLSVFECQSKSKKSDSLSQQLESKKEAANQNNLPPVFKMRSAEEKKADSHPNLCPTHPTSTPPYKRLLANTHTIQQKQTKQCSQKPDRLPPRKTSYIMPAP